MTITALAMVLGFAPLSSEAQIMARYQEWDAAYFVQDVKKLAGVLHSKFTLITKSGRVVSRRDYVARLWKSELPESYYTSVLRLNVTGDQAVVWTLERSKKAREPLSEHLYKDTWRQSDGVWKLIQSKTVGER